LLLKDDPTNPSNRRISIIVRNQGMDEFDEKMAAQPGAQTAPPVKAERPSAVMLPPAAAAKK
jgi:hypothetical protein